MKDITVKCLGWRRGRFRVAFAAIAAAVSIGLCMGGSEPANEKPTVSTVKPMRIGVIGAGSLGGTVGRIWCKPDMRCSFPRGTPRSSCR
jgi:hypothetical protein